MLIPTKPIDPALLDQELTTAGVVHIGLAVTDRGDEVEILTADDTGALIDLPPEAAPVVDAHTAPPPLIELTETVVVKLVARTTDDQPHEVFRLPTAVKHIYDAVLKMRAIDAVSGTTKVQAAEIVFKRTPVGLVQVGTTQPGPPFQDTAASSWAIQAAPDGTDLVVTVKGALGRTVDHLLSGTVDVFAPEGLAEA